MLSESSKNCKAEDHSSVGISAKLFNNSKKGLFSSNTSKDGKMPSLVQRHVLYFVVKVNGKSLLKTKVRINKQDHFSIEKIQHWTGWTGIFKLHCPVKSTNILIRPRSSFSFISPARCVTPSSKMTRGLKQSRCQ